MNYLSPVISDEILPLSEADKIAIEYPYSASEISYLYNFICKMKKKKGLALSKENQLDEMKRILDVAAQFAVSPFYVAYGVFA